MSNYKLKKIIANKINESSIGFNIQEEYGMRYELEKYEDQIKLEYGPQTFRDLQLKVQENREEEVAEWLEKNNFIKPETTEFHESIVKNQIKSIIKKAINKGSVNEGKGQDLADKYVAQLRQEFKNLNDDELDEFKKTLSTAFDMKLNENDYPTSAPRVYVLMLGNRSRGTLGPYRIYADKAAAEAEAAKQEAEGRDTRAFVQDLPFIK
jgi:hypothetical protein